MDFLKLLHFRIMDMLHLLTVSLLYKLEQPTSPALRYTRCLIIC